MSIQVDKDLCQNCGLCSAICSKNVFNEKGIIITSDNCKGCGTCEIICPQRAISSLKKEKLVQSEKNEKSKKQKRGGIKNIKVKNSGRHLLSGNEACAKGALDAGCLFFAGYPITPASEIMYAMLELNNDPNGTFVQMEDEISSMAAIIGASWAGKKSMTATSGPGFSLMQENIGYAVMTETPCVVIDVQRAGPSTGQATRPACADIMQAVWGSHGDSPKVVLMPTNAQECYDLTIKAFYISEKFRTPVIILIDEIIAHTEEIINIPEKIKIYKRKYIPEKKEVFGPESSMPNFGDGEFLSITGSTHKNNGIRAAADPDVQQHVSKNFSLKMKLVEQHLISSEEPKILKKTKKLIITCGFVSRSARQAILETKKENQLMVIRSISPFPYSLLQKIKKQNIEIAVIEMNQGQLIHMVREIFPNAISLTQNNGLTIEPSRIKKYLETGEWENEK